MAKQREIVQREFALPAGSFAYLSRVVLYLNMLWLAVTFDVLEDILIAFQIIALVGITAPVLVSTSLH